MAATIPSTEWVSLIYNPPATAAPASAEGLRQMKFDKDHFSRAYLLCRGRGGTEQQCKQLPEDTHVTPRTNTMELYKKELVDAIECMADHGDAQKCNHYTEAAFKKMHYEEPAKGTLAKLTGTAENIGYGKVAVGLPVAFMAYRFIKFA
eukprot:CAMPEP_0204271230 /NCGR_PEP_ID=MMETSP0468-20130131/19339_1 /ASSEMBLY_ACC=CAM_ASM_000383 /TAXON_ID=2969 /ORGANISM="Oxyrrhis marina" /LENGTH=148 /DNA_ID=CAMNT_0051246855 /DNA_START=61 /DNA_END=507 /DNA_ORIENTATION=+